LGGGDPEEGDRSDERLKRDDFEKPDGVLMMLRVA